MTPSQKNETGKSGLKIQIRWLKRCDMPEVLYIERSCFARPWSEEDFICRLRQRNCIGMVAELEPRILGFMVYELHKSTIRLLNVAVDPAMHRYGIGTQMVNRLVEKLSQQRRSEVILEVRETNLDAQCFFRSQGFKAISVLHGHYEDTREDAYVMRYRLPNADDGWLQPYAPANRLTEFDAA